MNPFFCRFNRHALMLGLAILLPSALPYETLLRNGRHALESPPTNSSFPTVSPTHSSNNLDTCEDSATGTFFVDDQRGNRGCVWLSKRPSWLSTLCHSNHDAFHVCPETCGKCSDACHDSALDEFWVNNVQRYKNCSWLAVSPGFREQLCHIGNDAFELCKDTCNNCLVPTSTPSHSPTSSPFPSVVPSASPSLTPSSTPTSSPTESPSLNPTRPPSASPSKSPSEAPSVLPTEVPSEAPSVSPSTAPSDSPTRYPSAVPTLAPSEAPVYIDPCDDSLEETFVVDEQRGNRGCIWLSKRPEWQATLCVPEHDAYHVCPELCGKCSDSCHDSPDQVFWVNNVRRYQNCSWLALSPGWRDELCHEDHEAYELCRETCDNCLPPPTSSPTLSQRPSASPSSSPSLIPSLTPTSSPTESPTSSPTETPSGYPTSTPTASPTSQPTLTPSNSPSEKPVSVLNTCEDSLDVTFFVDSDRGNQDCTWLARRPQWHATLCVNGHDAYDICEETCGKCTDACHDTSGEVFWVNNSQRYKDCAWLSLRPAWQETLCHPGHYAYDLCQETCNSCL